MRGLLTAAKKLLHSVVRWSSPFWHHILRWSSRLGFLVTLAFAKAGIAVLQFVLETPIYLRHYPTRSFEILALRDQSQSFLESYSLHLRKYRLSILVTLGLFIVLMGQLFVFGYGVYRAGRPTQVIAQTNVVTLTDVWDRTGIKNEPWTFDGFGCVSGTTTFSCEADNTRLLASFSNNSSGGTVCPATDSYRRSGMQFSLSSIPNAAIITKVELLVTVFDPSANSISIGRSTTDNGSGLSCASFYNDFLANTYITTSTFSTAVAKTLDLGATAKTDVQSRLNTTDAISISFGNTGTDSVTLDSLETANPPQLRVTYTSAPSAPSAPSVSSSTSHSITWSWTDNATEETQYDLHDGSHQAVSGCSALPANSISCTETGLSPNTNYSRHVQVTDPIGTTEGGSASGYTAAADPAVTSDRSTATWYTSGAFTFSNAAAWGAGGVEYYRYVWNTSSTFAFTGSESTWSSLDANCPGGTCDVSGTSLPLTTNTDSPSWYLHLQSYNGNDQAATSQSFGPYYFDSTGPTAPSNINDGTGADIDTTTATSQLSANWTAASDVGSGLDHYEYAIGTSAGGTQVSAFTSAGTNTTVTKTGLTLNVGTTYYFSVRTVDTASNVSATQSSDGVTVVASTASPSTPDSSISTPTISSPSDGQSVNEPYPEIRGSGPSTADIFIVVDRVINVVVRADASGNFSARLQSPLVEGSHAVFVRARVGSNVSPESSPITVIRSGGGIPVTIRHRYITDGTNPSVTFEGVAPTNSTVQILLDESIYQTFFAGPSTTTAYGFLKTVTVPDNIAAGQHTLSFIAINANGKASYETGQTTFTKSSSVVDAPDISYSNASEYVVQSGDSLWSIAAKFLGDGQAWPQIQQANEAQYPSLTTQPHLIYPGWVLHIPSG